MSAHGARSPRAAWAVVAARVVLAVGAISVADGVAAACEARVVLDPPEAWVGQQVLHEIVITGVARGATVEWLHPPSLPDVRVRSLPPGPVTDADPPGTRRQRRAVHPARAGRLTLPPTPFRCRAEGRSEAVVRHTPEAVLVAKAPPTHGRPPSWRGLVGPVTLQVHASAEEMRVGETVELRATLAGPGLVRQAGFAWPRAALEASGVAPELFEAPPVEREQPGLALAARRIERLDVVPHAPGELWVPSIEVAYLDPDTGRYAFATSDPIAVAVHPELAQPARDAEGAAGSAERGRGGPGAGLALAIGVLGVGAAALFAWRRRAARRA